MLRQIVLDTETTGLSAEQGHRVIEIGCVELIDRQLTGRHFHVYLNPKRQVDEGAFRVHGISDDFLKDKPFFEDVFNDFYGFVEGSELIIHNAVFDIAFLDAELNLLKEKRKMLDICTVFDTLLLAREKHPGQKNNLDALCKRYNIDNSNRELHGALLDAEILARVYLAMTGGQASLFANEQILNSNPVLEQIIAQESCLKSTSPVHYASEDEKKLHQQFIDFIEKKSGITRFVTE